VAGSGVGSTRRSRTCRSAIVGLAIAICLALIAIPALADQGTAGIPLPPPPPSGSGDSNGDAGSAAGYPDASQAQAENLFTDNFSSTVDSLASDPPDLSGEHPVFLDNKTALISSGAPAGDTLDQIDAALKRDAHDGQAAQADVDAILQQAQGQGQGPELLASTLPLRTQDDQGQQAPVDLSLDSQASGYQPQNPLVDLTLPSDLSHDVAVGDQGIKVDLGATDPNAAGDATADTVAGDNLFYADAAPATDVLLAPTRTGVEALYQLRAPESPNHLEMGLTLPDGASLQSADGGGASVVRNGDMLATVYAPSAQDAAGNPVPVSMSVDGNDLKLDVDTSAPDVRYPISVDPAIDTYTWSTNGAGAFSDWVANQTTGSPYQLRTTCLQNVTCSSGTTGPVGLYSLVPANQAVTPSTGAWQYSVPHYPSTSAFISALTLGPMTFNTRTDSGTNPLMFGGILNPNTGSYVASQSQSATASNLNWSFNAGLGQTGGKQAVFELYSGTSRTVSAWRSAYLGGAGVTLSDTDSPVLSLGNPTGISFNSNGYSNWIDDATPTISASATDGGLGIDQFQFLIPYVSGSGDQTVNKWCTGANASPCPQSSSSGPVSFDASQMANGVNAIGIIASDAVDKADVDIEDVRVDHARPRISLSGGLAPGGGSGDAYTLHIDATDGDTSAQADWQSGVKQITLDVNGDPVSLSGAGPQDCTRDAGSCSMSVDYTLHAADYNAQSLHFTVDATDQLDHHALGAGDQPLDWTLVLPNTSIDSGPSGPTKDTTPSFSYSSPTAGASFQCRVDDAPFADCPASGYTVPTALAEGSHTLDVRAVDGNGHVDGTPASQTFMVDTHDPSFDLSGDLIPGTNPLVGTDPEVDVDATDTRSGVASADILIDGEQADEVTPDDCPTTPCELHDILAPDLSQDSQGAHSYEVIVTDAAGNTSEQQGTFRLDPTPPELIVTGGLANSDGDQLPGHTGTATIQATDNGTGDSGVANIQVSVDDTTDLSQDTTCAPACPGQAGATYTYHGSDWGEGPHDVQITATDQAGNSTDYLLEVDVPAPMPTAQCPNVSPAVDTISNGVDPQTAEQQAPTQTMAPSDPAPDPDPWGDGQDNLAPSLVRPDVPPTPLNSAGSLSDDNVASAPLAQVNVDDAVCLVPTRTTSDERQADLDNGTAAVYANAAPQTDTIVRPAAAGETLIQSLRGVGAPTTFSWQVGIPDGTELQTLSDGGVAVVDSAIPAPTDTTVPAAPAEAMQISGIPKASVQLDEEAHEVAFAEQETGNAVEAVITPPYTVDSAGVHTAALSVGPNTTITAPAAAGSQALVFSAYENAKRRSAPRAVRAFYTTANSAKGLKTLVRNQVCKFQHVKRDIPNIRRTLVLSMGGADKLNDGYGAGGSSNRAIFLALRAGAVKASSLGSCPLGRVNITYGNTNNIHMETDNARDAGKAQAHQANMLQSFMHSPRHRAYTGQEQAALGGDIEMGYSGADNGVALATGAANHFAGRYYDYGDAEGCPPEGSGGCDGSWTLSDIANVSYGHGARALPEIYCLYHENEAAQWANVAQAGPSSYHFAGTSGENDSQGLSPAGGWKRLNKLTHRYVGRELINFPRPENSDGTLKNVCGSE
jgi:hypothetical protein